MWCPKCKIEYREGIMVCADCGTPLESGSARDFDVVDICSLKDEQMAKQFLEYLEYSGISGARQKQEEETGVYTITVPTGLEKKAEKLFEGFMIAREEEREREREAKRAAGQEQEEIVPEEEEEDDSPELQEYDWDAEEEETEKASGIQPFDTDGAPDMVPEGEMEDMPKELLYTPSKEYVKKSEEYKDLKFSGVTFILFGVAGCIYLLLCRLDIIPIRYNLVVLLCLAAMFAVFVVLGISSMIKSGRIKELIPVEEQKTREIKEWLQGNLTDEMIAGWRDSQVTEAENDLLVMARIRASLIRQYPGEDTSYLEMLSEEYYNESVAVESPEEDADGEE